MYFGGFLLRRPGSWPTWLAFRSTVTAASALVAAIVLRTAALPKLTRQISDLDAVVPEATNLAIGTGGWLIVLPLPGLILGLAAIAVRSLRPVLAVLAAIMTFLAVVGIVAALVVSLLPMYHMSCDLGLGPG